MYAWIFAIRWRMLRGTKRESRVVRRRQKCLPGINILPVATPVALRRGLSRSFSACRMSYRRKAMPVTTGPLHFIHRAWIILSHGTLNATQLSGKPVI